MHPSLANIPWRVRVSQAIRDVRIEVIGREDIKNESHADALIAVLRAFGSSPKGFVYVEPYLAKKSVRPQDVLLCHPEVGVLIIEAKGHGINDITRVAAGNLFIKLGSGGTTQKNAFKQAETAMFDVKSAVERALGRGGPQVPIFDFVVAMPRITEADWASKGFDKSLDRSRLLLRDDLTDPHRFRMRIDQLVREGISLSRRSIAMDPACIDVVRAAFGDSAVIQSDRPARDPVDEDTIGGMIEYEESLDKNLSEEQNKLSRLAVGEHPRVVRGVAGSGKSVVLANLVASYIRRSQTDLAEGAIPKWPKVGVTCFNRALVPFLESKIRTAFRDNDLFQQRKSGGDLIVDHFNHMMKRFPMPHQYIVPREDKAVEMAIQYRADLHRLRQSDPARVDAALFDILFVDEGQDFAPEEYLLLRDLVRPHPVSGEQPMLIFYDNAQNLYGRPQPTWSEVGIDVARGDRTRVMTTCFRNTRQILELAFNIIYGSQAKEAVHNRQFLDMETLNKNRSITEGGKAVRVHFACREGSLPVIRRFASREAELDFVAKEIRRLIVDEYVRPSDILVLFRTDYNFQSLPDRVLAMPGVSDRIKGAIRVYGQTDAKDEYIMKEDHLTLATINSAKGYDSPVVFLVGAENFSSKEPTDRAFLYVGATRAKHRLYLTGLKYGTDNLLAEARDVEWALSSMEGNSDN